MGTYGNKCFICFILLSIWFYFMSDENIASKQFVSFFISNSMILECSQHARKHFGIGSEGLQPFADMFLHLLSFLICHVNLGSLLLRARY